jgi:hypothetical protein
VKATGMKEQKDVTLYEASAILKENQLSYLRMRATIMDVIRAEGVVYSLGSQAGDIMIAKHEARKLYDEKIKRPTVYIKSY